MVIVLSVTLIQCTKVEKGYLSPTMAYSVSAFTAIQGRTASSYGLVSDGSSLPLTIELQHAYDSKGQIVDSMFTKTYPVTVWTAAYNNLTDTSFAAIAAKRTAAQLPPVIINPKSGVFQTNSATVYLPLDSYTFDLKVTNAQGTIVLPKIITMNLTSGKQIETAPEQGAYSVGRLIANTASGATTYSGAPGSFNGANNPFVVETIVRYADTPNVLTYTIRDKNGVVFNAKNGEIMKRPNSGLNPTPPFLQNLQDYAPDTFNQPDSGSLSLKYPLVPFPIASLGNGYNMYYRIPTAYVVIDSTTTWSSNTAGSYYKGSTDSHYKGAFQTDLYDYSVRLPLVVQVPGAYYIGIKLLNAKHR